MRMPWRPLTLVSGGALVPALLAAQAQPMAHPMTEAQYIKAAEAAGPPAIARNAAIARVDPQGNVTTVRAGTNGFTCVVGVPGDPDAAICGDKQSVAWLLSAATNAPKPTNTEPGIAYMAAGGVHDETAMGEIKMAADSTTHRVQEPPHWMLFWPIDAATSGLPTKPNPSGVYIMFAGTPYAHLMIYQDPKVMKP